MSNVPNDDTEHSVSDVDGLHVHQATNPSVAVTGQLFAVTDTLNVRNFSLLKKIICLIGR